MTENLLCECGHVKSSHGYEGYSIEPRSDIGKGICRNENCPCKKFKPNSQESHINSLSGNKTVMGNLQKTPDNTPQTKPKIYEIDNGKATRDPQILLDKPAETSLSDKIEEKVEAIKTIMRISGENNYSIGKIQGLRAAEELFEEAVKKILESIDNELIGLKHSSYTRLKIKEIIKSEMGEKLI